MSCKLRPAGDPPTAFQGPVGAQVALAVIGTTGAPQILYANYAGQDLAAPWKFTIKPGVATLSVSIANTPGDSTQIVEVCGANANQTLLQCVFDPLGVVQLIEIQGIAAAAAPPTPSRKRAARALVVLGMLLLGSFAAKAQNYKYVYGDEKTFPDLAATKPANRDAKQCVQFLDLTGPNITKLALRAVQDGTRKFFQTAENARLDKQTGSSPSSAGTTSIVSKGIAPQFLSLAVEDGALAQTDSQSVATFTANALNVARLARGDHYFPYCAALDSSCESTAARVLAGLSASVSFNTAAGQSSSTATDSSSNSTVLTGSARQLSAWGARYDFNARKPVTAKDAVDKIKTTDGRQYFEGVVAAMVPLREAKDPVTGDRPYVLWLDKYSALIKSAADEKAFQDLLTEAADALIQIGKRYVPAFQDKVDSMLTAMATYFGQRDKALDALIDKVTYSVDYKDNRPADQPAQSTLTLIVSGRPDAADKWQVTFNGSGSWYDDPPAQAAVQRFRDAQAALQADFALTGTTSPLGVSVSAGFYFQYQADNALLTIPSGDLAPGTSIALPGSASVLLKTKGSIAIGQIGATFSVPNTGIKIPIAVSYSNRTDLIKASDVRGHLGVSYDLDSLFAGQQ